MQKIFHNLKCLTFNDSLETAEAFFCNDESIVFAGNSKEVLEMKADETQLIDLSGKVVVPTFFDTDGHIFQMIENNLKTQNNDKFIEKQHKNDENYEIFENFDIYLKELLKIQDDYLSSGITTVYEMNITDRSFAFWKKLYETDKLKIDIVGYVDMLSAKSVMDNNCRSFRKYKSHFRLGGYCLNLDGRLTQKKAWLTKPYKSERGYSGYGLVVDEQLSILLKTAIEEKKQVICEVNGDKALEQFLRVIDEVYSKKKDDDKYLPIVKNCSLISNKNLKKLKELNLLVDFDISDIKNNTRLVKKIIGSFRFKRLLPLSNTNKFGLNIMFHSSDLEVPNIFKTINFLKYRISSENKVVGKKHKISIQDALLAFTKTSARYCFDEMYKGSLESGKHANFLVLSEDVETSEKLNDLKVEKVYLESNLVYENK